MSYSKPVINLVNLDSFAQKASDDKSTKADQYGNCGSCCIVQGVPLYKRG